MLYQLKSKLSIECWLISVLFIIGLLIRLFHLDGSWLGYDEIFTTIRINHSLFDTIRLLGHSEFPPLHYIILNLWTHVLGHDEWALRFPSAIFSSLTILVVYKLGKELFNKEVGLISVLLLTFSPFALNYAQYAKMYALFWFLAAGSFLFFFRFLKDQKSGSYRLYISASILCCYTMYTGFLLLLTQSVIFLFLGEKTRRQKWFTGQLIVLAFCAPWIIFFLCSRHHFFILDSSSAAFDYVAFFERSFLFMTGSCPDNLMGVTGSYWGGELNCFLYVFLILFLLIKAFSYNKRKIGFYFSVEQYCLLMWIIIPTLIYFVFDCFFVHVKLGVRYIGFLQVPLILLVSSQINHLYVLIRGILVSLIVVIALSNICLYFRDNAGYSSLIAENLFISGKGNDQWWFGDRALAARLEDIAVRVDWAKMNVEDQ